MGLDPVEFRMQQAREVILELRDAIQEAHGLLKDLKQSKRDIDEYICPGIDNRLDTEVRKQLERLNVTTKKAIDSSTQAVFNRFDKLAALLMGEEDDRPTVEELVKQKVELERDQKH
jgi:hypothetical protein